MDCHLERLEILMEEIREAIKKSGQSEKKQKINKAILKSRVCGFLNQAVQENGQTANRFIHFWHIGQFGSFRRIENTVKLNSSFL
jgi:hypothetical protein